MNKLTAEQWVESWDADNASYDVWLSDTKQIDQTAEHSYGWLGRMTNRAYEAWLARGGIEAAVE